MKTVLTILLVCLGGLAFIGLLFSKAHNYPFPRFHRWLTILLLSLVGLAFIGTLAMNAVLTHVFFSFGGIAVFWGIFLQMGPTLFALYPKRKARLTLEELAIEMAAKSNQQLLAMFPKVFDMSDEQLRVLFPTALAMFPQGFLRSLDALNAARLELQKRNIPIPPVDFQPLPFMQLEGNRDLKRVLIWCLFIALLSIPTSLFLIHLFDEGVVLGQNNVTLNSAAILVLIAAPILAVISTLGLVVIPCALFVQYTVYLDRQRKLAALAAAVADSRHESKT